MKSNYIFLIVLIIPMLFACKKSNKKELIDENELGIIDANVKSEDTNLKEKAEYTNTKPGKSEKFDRSFENAPPLIPHSIAGFLPIKKENNICFSCHMPDKVEKSGATAISSTHFTNLRPKMVEVDGTLQFEQKDEEVKVLELKTLNNAYFNCSQCHVAQTNATVNIENLFTPEFREEYGLEKSNLKEKIKEGVE